MDYMTLAAKETITTAFTRARRIVTLRHWQAQVVDDFCT